MSKTLTRQVEEMVDKKIRLSQLAADMLATLQLNVDREHIVAVNEVARINLIKIIANWRKQLGEIEGDAEDPTIPTL